jgi:hypothetical protein
LSATHRQAGVSASVPHDRANDGDQFSCFPTQIARLISRTQSAGFADAESGPRLAAFFQSDTALRDEVAPAFSGASFFQHRWQRCAAANELWNHHSADATAVVELLTEPDDATRESERSVAYVLAILIGG